MKKYFWLIIFTFSSSIITTGEEITAPQMQNDIQKEQILEWGDINIICNISTHEGENIYWETADKTFHMDGIELLIHNISRASAGLYICYASDVSTEALQYVLIEVLYAANILSIDIPQDILHENATFTLTATVEGNPPPETMLLSESSGKLVNSAEGEGTINMTISSVQCDDTGTYVLNCVNGFSSSTRTIDVSVFCAPYMDPTVKQSFELHPRLGDGVTLEMQSAGFPQPNYTWWYNDNIIEHTDDGYKSSVVINQMSVNNFGTYHIYMENVVGSTNYIYQVTPVGPPELPTNMTLLKYTSDSATLSWKPGYDYNSTQTFVLRNSELGELKEIAEFADPSNDTGQKEIIYTINNLQEGHDYNITVEAKNLYGASSGPDSIRFTTKDDKGAFSDGMYAVIVVAVAIFVVTVFAVVFRRRTKTEMRYSKISGTNDEKQERQNCAPDKDSVPGKINITLE